MTETSSAAAYGHAAHKPALITRLHHCVAWGSGLRRSAARR